MFCDYPDLAVFSPYLIQSEITLVGINPPLDLLLKRYSLSVCNGIFIYFVQSKWYKTSRIRLSSFTRECTAEVIQVFKALASLDCFVFERLIILWHWFESFVDMRVDRAHVDLLQV